MLVFGLSYRHCPPIPPWTSCISCCFETSKSPPLDSQILKKSASYLPFFSKSLGEGCSQLLLHAVNTPNVGGAGMVRVGIHLPRQKLACPLKRGNFRRKRAFQPLFLRAYVSFWRSLSLSLSLSLTLSLSLSLSLSLFLSLSLSLYLYIYTYTLIYTPTNLNWCRISAINSMSKSGLTKVNSARCAEVL